MERRLTRRRAVRPQLKRDSLDRARNDIHPLTRSIALFCSGCCIVACGRSPTSRPLAIIVADSLRAAKPGRNIGPLSRRDADSVFQIQRRGIEAVLGPAHSCRINLAQWHDSSGTLFVVNRGPDAVPFDTTAALWGLLIGFDSGSAAVGLCP
jgi:hypothetical protein